MKRALKAPGNERLKLECEGLLSKFAFNFNLRRFAEASGVAARPIEDLDAYARGLTSFVYRTNTFVGLYAEQALATSPTTFQTLVT
jgi:hypothetical protein